MTKRPKPFNNPFSDLKLAKPSPSGQTRTAPAPPPARKPSHAVEEDEAALFLASVGEVAPVRSRAPVSAPPPPEHRPIRVIDPEEEAMTELAELVAGNGPMDLADTDEYVEGHAPGLDARILKRLRAGEYAVQAHLDLHGLTRAEAKAALEAFVVDSKTRGRRCVLVVHG
ncbi:MAG TPA: Smr/MutS family protein, partial [Myxococcaceae bacterium]|nr:Smr/MutS family protein [Myxococcaceae bacterium]